MAILHLKSARGIRLDYVSWLLFVRNNRIVLCIYYIISGGYLLYLHSFAQMNTKKYPHFLHAFVKVTVKFINTKTRCELAGGTCELSWFFSRIINFMLFTVLLSLMYFFRRNSDSRFTIIDRICWACAIFRSIPNLQAHTDGQTDGQTDELIQVGLCNLSLSVPPGKIPTYRTQLLLLTVFFCAKCSHTVFFNTRCTWVGGMCELLWFFLESSVSCYFLCYSRLSTIFEKFLIHDSQ